MTFIDAPTTFYLGRRYDPAAGKLTGEVVYYDSRDLTTHAVVLGMTGSGKTGLCWAALGFVVWLAAGEIEAAAKTRPR